MKDYQIEEWKRIVERAEKELSGACPLLCDETIVAVDECMKQQAAEIEALREEVGRLRADFADANTCANVLRQERDRLKIDNQSIQLRDCQRDAEVIKRLKSDILRMSNHGNPRNDWGEGYSTAMTHVAEDFDRAITKLRQESSEQPTHDSDH